MPAVCITFHSRLLVAESRLQPACILGEGHSPAMQRLPCLDMLLTIVEIIQREIDRFSTYGSAIQVGT